MRRQSAAGSRSLSYAELNEQATGLSRRLIAAGAGPGQRIAICLERGLDLMTAVLGVLKAGAAYVTIDPDVPRTRSSEMLEDARPLAIVSRAGLTNELDVCPRVVDIDDVDDPPNDISPGAVRGDDLAYIVYTSGTTGRPKGVMVTHTNLAAACASWQSAYGLEPGDPHLQMANAAFDVFTGDWVRALTSGGCLVICPRDELLDPARLYALIEREQIRVAEFVPVVVRTLLQYVEQHDLMLSTFKLLVVGSDAWSSRDYRALVERCSPDARVINSYGVAEATIDSSWYHGEVDSRRTLPIGEPFDHCRLYVCDEHLQLLPPGMPGELCVGGLGVAAGYWSDPELTAERFVPDPFEDAPGARLYRTGDRVCRRADGSLELLGRLDEQIKLRGFRIEPAEVERMISTHPDVAAVAVALRESPAGDQQMIGYVVASGADAPDDLRSFLCDRLPDYMIPTMFEPVVALPVSRNGKLDRSALPEPRWRARTARGGTLGPVEDVVCELFGELLDEPIVDAHSDFFARGGHSLLAAQLVSRVRDVFDVELPLKSLFDAPTPAGIAKIVSDRTGIRSSSSPLRKNLERAPLSLMQQRLWFFASARTRKHCLQSSLARPRYRSSRPRAPRVSPDATRCAARNAAYELRVTGWYARAAHIAAERRFHKTRPRC